jgi:hypothetical protein
MKRALTLGVLTLIATVFGVSSIPVQAQSIVDVTNSDPAIVNEECSVSYSRDVLSNPGTTDISGGETISYQGGDRTYTGTSGDTSETSLTAPTSTISYHGDTSLSFTKTVSSDVYFTSTSTTTFIDSTSNGSETPRLTLGNTGEYSNIVTVDNYSTSSCDLEIINTPIYPADGYQQAPLQGEVVNSDTESTASDSWEIPYLVTSNPTGGGSISGASNTFSAIVSDPDSIVQNVRFVLYDTGGNLLSDSNSSQYEDGAWVADSTFNSTEYADGYGYVLEIISEGEESTSFPNYRPTFSWDAVYFGIDNVKTNEIITYPEESGITIINKEFEATAYQYIPYGDMPVSSTSVHFYYLDKFNNRIPQGSAYSMTKDPDPYNGLWRAEILDSRTIFTEGNGQYIALFTAVYADGDTKTKEVSFEVYNSDNETPPAVPIAVNPKDGITLAPGTITYGWTGNEGDDIVSLDFERGEYIDGIFEPRAGGGREIRDGSFSWTEDGLTPTEPVTINWRIRVKDRSGNWSEWSEASSYTIDPNFVGDTTPPSKPDMLSPANNQNVNSSNFIHSWESTSGDIDYYIYESYRDPQQKNLLIREIVNTNTRAISDHDKGAVWWRIQAVDYYGNLSEWSDLFKMIVSNKK